jgi:GR25 family glycosyltransferase involved in LPS biosynthesis
MSVIKLYLEPKIIDYWINPTKYYSMQTLHKFLEYFLPSGCSYKLTIQNDAKIAIWDIQQDNDSFMNDNQLNMMICVENCNHHKHYQHYNKFGNYGNSKINIYFYNHITNVELASNYIAIPMIHVFMNHYKNHFSVIQPTTFVPFDQKKFCLVMNRSNINPHIQMFRNILSHIGTIDDISMFETQLGSSSCYHSLELINLLQQYKFVLCIENSYSDGYITEKIFNCLYAQTIPLYMGSVKILNYIHQDRIINLLDMPQNVLGKIMSINQESYNRIIKIPAIVSQYNDENYKVELQQFIENWKPALQPLVYYINLDRREDRETEFLNKIKSTSLANSVIKKFSAIDGTSLQDNLAQRNLDRDPIILLLAHLRNKNNPSMRHGVLGCCLSHYFLLKDIFNDPSICDNQIVYIFEDDVFFSKDDFENELLEIQNFKQPWDILFVGGRWNPNFAPNGDYEHFEKATNHLYKRLQTSLQYQQKLGNSLNLDRGAMGYCVKKNSIPRILDQLFNFLNNNPFQAIDAIYVRLDINAFDYFPHLFYSPLYYNKSDIQTTKTIKIAYLDFWQEYSDRPLSFKDIQDPKSWTSNPQNKSLIKIDQGVGIFHKDYLENLLQEKVEIVHPKNADVIICSQFGNLRSKYPNTKKICLVFESDFSVLNEPNTIYFSSHITNDPRQFYLPLTALYYGFSIYEKLQTVRNFSINDIKQRQHCCSIISNFQGEFRNEFLFKLMDVISVDNYGKLYQNVTDALIKSTCWYDPNLSPIIKQYKFMICMENIQKEGYHSEKILHAFLNNVIPIYWGDPNIVKVFNPNSFINVNELGIKLAIQKIAQLCQNDQEYVTKLNEPIIHDTSILSLYNEKKLIQLVSSACKT